MKQLIFLLFPLCSLHSFGQKKASPISFKIFLDSVKQKLVIYTPENSSSPDSFTTVTAFVNYELVNNSQQEIKIPHGITYVYPHHFAFGLELETFSAVKNKYETASIIESTTEEIFEDLEDTISPGTNLIQAIKVSFDVRSAKGLRLRLNFLLSKFNPGLKDQISNWVKF